MLSICQVILVFTVLQHFVCVFFEFQQSSVFTEFDLYWHLRDVGFIFVVIDSPILSQLLLLYFQQLVSELLVLAEKVLRTKAKDQDVLQKRDSQVEP